MAAVGVLVCGYSDGDARTIKAFLDKALDTFVIMVSASPHAEAKVIDILRSPQERFEAGETKVMIFLGFSEVQIHMVLEGFPKGGGLKRPIFCSLTAQNREWPLRELVAHLEEEHRRWTGKREQDPAAP